MSADRSVAKPMRVDFGYAFATPHRLTVCLPDSRDKTLADCQPEFLRLAWTYDDLRRKPLAAFTAPKANWDLRLSAELDGKPLPLHDWHRAEGWLPVLEATFGKGAVRLQLGIAGGSSAAIARLSVANQDRKPHRLVLRCEKPGGWAGCNPAWVQPEWDADVLLAGWQDRADRVLVLGLGGDANPVTSATALNLAWDLKPGTRRTAWLVRPYRAYEPMLPALRKRNWAWEFDAAKTAWRKLIGRAARVTVPDAGVGNAFRACLADCFVMRETVADGSVVATPGTEVYRAPNPFEPLIVSVLFDQLGLHREAAGNTGMFLRQQGRDGNWADPEGWCHYMWGASGVKSWATMEHWRLTGDRRMLAAAYPRMAASSRWQESQRRRTRVTVKGKRPLAYGLMPRGMGDGGLKDDDDLYGVFLTHNILAVYADAMAVEAAEILGRKRDLAELRRIHRRARTDLLRVMERGAIAENGYRWIPGVPGKTCGSRWGALYAAFPCRILAPDHELITGTIRKFESRMSPGGIPVHTGWMKDGMWVAITLDNLAEVLLLRGEGDAAARYLYATLNHGTPLFTWCEERGQEPGAKDCSGDRQHLWTPVAVARFLRDALVMEDGGALHLVRGAARQWLGSGEPVGVRGMATHFGRLSYELRYDARARRVTGSLDLDGRAGCRVVLHLRLPGGLRAKSISGVAGAKVSADGEAVEWSHTSGRVKFEMAVG
ncbi:MAG TPA: hypothetical protein PK280_13250 [Planctomycetota bacterium]|nr:hypothetical protein [Planctomycetota bacterium]